MAAEGLESDLRHRPRARGATALFAVLVLILSLPITATAGAAAPVTLGDWMRIIFVTPDRELDASQAGLAAATPIPPPPALQTSSEPSAPKEPIVRTNVPRFWLSGDLKTQRKRRRGRSHPR